MVSFPHNPNVLAHSTPITTHLGSRALYILYPHSLDSRSSGYAVFTIISTISHIATRRFRGRNVSRAEAHSRNQKILTDAQDSALIKHIRKLSDRGLHPAPRILENLAFELIRKPIDGRWIE